MSKKDKPKIDFFTHYQEIYGERWPALWQALKQSESRVARLNFFSLSDTNSGDVDLEKIFDLGRLQGLQATHWNPALRAFQIQAGQSVVLQKNENDIYPFYVMDPASLVAARNLNIQPGQRVLDMCAAPGGKSLVLAEELFYFAKSSDSDPGELILNELSAERRDRLQKVIKSYIPYEKRKNIWVRGQDASLFGVKQPESFDRVLLDAPCSSEAHVLASEAAQKEWTVKRSKGLAQRQFSMISSAFLSLKSGGEVIYSTCSIHPQENDEVIEKLIDRRGQDIEVVDEIDSLGLPFQKSKWGFEFFPDQSGCGPFYLARFRKR